MTVFFAGVCLMINDHLWIGQVKDNWHQASHWSRGVIPEDCDHVVISKGSEVRVSAGAISQCDTLDIELSSSIEVEAGSVLKIHLYE